MEMNGGDRTRRRLDEKMDWQTMPQEILEKTPYNKWEFLIREPGPDEGIILVMFKCKNDCETIFTLEHIKEMNRFVTKMVDHPNWPLLCLRSTSVEEEKDVKDGKLCLGDSYMNATSIAMKFLEKEEKAPTQEQINDVIKTYAPIVLADSRIRSMLSKDFSAENPKSNILGGAFKTTHNGNLVDSYFTGPDANGKYTENFRDTFTEE